MLIVGLVMNPMAIFCFQVMGSSEFCWCTEYV